MRKKRVVKIFSVWFQRAGRFGSRLWACKGKGKGFRLVDKALLDKIQEPVGV